MHPGLAVQIAVSWHCARHWLSGTVPLQWLRLQLVANSLNNASL
jgi:hypothetical protein